MVFDHIKYFFYREGKKKKKKKNKEESLQFNKKNIKITKRRIQ